MRQSGTIVQTFSLLNFRYEKIFILKITKWKWNRIVNLILCVFLWFWTVYARRNNEKNKYCINFVRTSKYCGMCLFFFRKCLRVLHSNLIFTNVSVRKQVKNIHKSRRNYVSTEIYKIIYKNTIYNRKFFILLAKS